MGRVEEVERKFQDYIEDYLLPMVIVVILGVAITWVTFSEGSYEAFC
ncbi:MAG: hypothetical protein XD43_1224 [Thermococcales archaeon 44_46]|jgi:hypothetical protein|nr:hypothetical protein [Thermococcus sp. 101 C5]KUJ99112.1 MAG: hypothetical protein XD43_1224 [Thermococcales archaeon 44_46]HIH72679.1 hypothetical protein [Thermococcaceae archaeon]